MSVNTAKGRKLVSSFQVLAGPLLAQYRAQGLTSREAAIIPKDLRDASPLTCQGMTPTIGTTRCARSPAIHDHDGCVLVQFDHPHARSNCGVG